MGVQADKNKKTNAPDIALVGMGGTTAAFLLLVGAIYEVNNEGSNSVLISLFVSYTILLSALCWYMACSKRAVYQHKTQYYELKKKVVKLLMQKKVNHTNESMQEVKKAMRISPESDYDLPPEIFESVVLPSSNSDEIIMGFGDE